MINIDYLKNIPVVKYKRNSQDCYLCLTRQKLIISSPEEGVRQSVINYLTKQLHVPISVIAAEVPMSYFKKGQPGRTDLIVDDEHGNILILVECKAPNVFLSDAVIEQVLRYDDIVKAKVIVITNGTETAAFERDTDSNLHPLSRIPTYTELIKNKPLQRIEIEDVKYERLDLSKPIPPELIAEHISCGFIGEDTSPLLYPFLFNLTDWMFNPEDQVAPNSFKHTNLIQDGGIRFAEFGNAGGGAFGGDYRYFILKDAKGNTQIVSLTITAIAKTVNDPQWGNRSSATILAVAIDDFGLSHMSLELRLDKYVRLEKSKAYVWHDGTLTVGKLGQAKRQAVIDYVALKAPHLISVDGKVTLGEFDFRQNILSNQPNTIQFLDNLILYAQLRDEYRAIHRATVLK